MSRPFAPSRSAAAGRSGRRRLPPRRRKYIGRARASNTRAVPAGVDLRRQVVPLRIVFVRAKLGMVVEVPSRELGTRCRSELRRADPSARFGDRRRRRTRCGAPLVQQDREIEDGEPWTSASGSQSAGYRSESGPRLARRESQTAELPRPRAAREIFGSSRIRSRGIAAQSSARSGPA